MNNQNRWKSKVLWAAIAAQFIALIGYLGLWEQWGIMPSQVETIVSSVLQILVLFGVINSPDNKGTL